MARRASRVQSKPDGRRRAKVAAVLAVCVLAAGAGFVWFGHRSWMAFVPQVTPSCSWPMRVHGEATAEQAGLVRCYLQALAGRDTIGLRALSAQDAGGTVRITRADLSHSADARSGLATVTFTPSRADRTYILLTIRYADGAVENSGLQDMTAMGGPSAWRMAIGAEQSAAGPGPARSAASTG